MSTEIIQTPIRPQAPCAAPRRCSDIRRFVLSIMVLLAILAAYNLLIAYNSGKSQRRHLLARIEQLPPQTDILVLGNSLVEAGFDGPAFQAAWPKASGCPQPSNIALGATTPVEHCLILERALRQPLPVRYVVYGFFDDQLNAPTRGDWSDLVGNRALSYYFPDQAADFYQPGSWLKRWQLRLTRVVPMFAERSSLWTKIELLRWRFADIGLPRHKTNRFGRVDDFAALEAKDVTSFTQRCQGVLHQNTFSRPVREIFKLARQRSARVILVEMPMPSKHRGTFYSTAAWQQLRAHLRQLAQQQQAAYLPASDWVSDDSKFEDATHLNEEGARLFSRRLAAELSQLAPAASQLASGSVRSRPAN